MRRTVVTPAGRSPQRKLLRLAGPGLLAEFSIVACDWAEVPDSALPFRLPPGAPILAGVARIVPETLIELGLKGNDFRQPEASVGLSVAIGAAILLLVRQLVAG